MAETTFITNCAVFIILNMSIPDPFHIQLQNYDDGYQHKSISI